MGSAHLNEEVIILGGLFEDNSRSDKVILSSSLSRLHDKIAGLQVLQYNLDSATWAEIGKMSMKRASHATAVANLNTFCAGKMKMGISLVALS